MTITATPAAALALSLPKNPSAPVSGLSGLSSSPAASSATADHAANNAGAEAAPQSFSAVFARLAKPATQPAVAGNPATATGIDATVALRQFFEAARMSGATTVVDPGTSNPLAAFFAQNNAARSAGGDAPNLGDDRTEAPDGDLAQWLAAMGLVAAASTSPETTESNQADTAFSALNARPQMAGNTAPTEAESGNREIGQGMNSVQDAARTEAERPFTSHIDEAERQTASPSDAVAVISNAPASEAQASLAANPTSNATTAATSAAQHLQAVSAGGAATATPTASPVSTAANLHLGSQVGTPDWAGELGQKVVWMAGNERQTAHLTLNPANLGPLEVSINLSRDQASAVFVSAHPEVREALENALPRLREMFAGAGIELGQSQVNSQSQRQQEQSLNGQGGRNTRTDIPAVDGESGVAGTTQITARESRNGNGLVDMFV